MIFYRDMEPPSPPMKITVSPPSASSLSSQRNEKAALTNSDAETKKLASTEASSSETQAAAETKTETRREKLMVTFRSSSSNVLACLKLARFLFLEFYVS